VRAARSPPRRTSRGRIVAGSGRSGAGYDLEPTRLRDGSLTCKSSGSTSFRTDGATNLARAPSGGCGSLARHRALHHVLDIEGRRSGRTGIDRCLPLAPEKVTHDRLAEAFGAGDLPADLTPAQYRHEACLKLRLPEDFPIFGKRTSS